MKNRDIFGGFPGARHIGDEELESVVSVINSRSPYRFYGLSPQGKSVALEAEFATFCKRAHSLAVSSGTAALHVALAALGIGEGDEVIIPAYGWSADVMAILAVGGVPVIADIDSGLGLDPNLLSRAIGSRTKAIIAVHMRGYPCKIKEICEIASDNGLPVIEDCAQCLGGKVSDRNVGSFGRMGVFSFQYNKLITGGEGGAIVCDDPQLWERACRFHDLGMFRKVGEADPSGESAIAGFGLNYRISELQAAMILPQLKKVPTILAGLENSAQKARSELSVFIEKFGLFECLADGIAKPNGAFICFSAPNQEVANIAIEEMEKEKIPAQICGARDPHHFETWKVFLKKGAYTYRDFAGKSNRSSDILDSTIAIELAS